MSDGNTKVKVQMEDDNKVVNMRPNTTAHERERSMAVRRSIVGGIMTVSTYAVTMLYMSIVVIMAFSIAKMLIEQTTGLGSFLATFGITDNPQKFYQIVENIRYGVISVVCVGMVMFHFFGNKHNYFRNPKEIASSLLFLGVTLIATYFGCMTLGFSFNTIAPILFATFIVVDTVFDIGDVVQK